MNLRQKAKMYKQMAEINEAKAKFFDQHARSYLNSHYGMYGTGGYGTIETLCVTKLWDDRCPEEFVKREIVNEIAECLLRDGYIDFVVDEDYDKRYGLRRVIARLSVTKRRRCDEI